jgi:hypothetical protein
MRAGVVTATIAIILLGGSIAAPGACPTGKHRGDCVDLGAVPQISQQIVAAERPVTTPAKAAPVPAVEKKPYSGPTVGLTPTVKKAPTVGYRWAID